MLLLGLLLAGGIVVDRLTFSLHDFPCPAAVDSTTCGRVKQGSPWYWSVGLVLIYAATAFFYIRRARSRGIGSIVRLYVLAGIIIVLLVGPTRFWDGGLPASGASADVFGLHFSAATGTESILNRLTGRAVSIGVPLLVLSWLERNRALLIFTIAYLVIELVPITIDAGGLGPTAPWSALAKLAVPVAFLLFGALAFALAERPERPERP